MTEKMYDNLLVKYKNSVFQKNMQSVKQFWFLIRQLGKKYTGLCNCLEIKSYKGFHLLVKVNIQIDSPTYVFST